MHMTLAPLKYARQLNQATVVHVQRSMCMVHIFMYWTKKTHWLKMWPQWIPKKVPIPPSTRANTSYTWHHIDECEHRYCDLIYIWLLHNHIHCNAKVWFHFPFEKVIHSCYFMIIALPVFRNLCVKTVNALQPFDFVCVWIDSKSYRKLLIWCVIFTWMHHQTRRKCCNYFTRTQTHTQTFKVFVRSRSLAFTLTTSQCN